MTEGELEIGQDAGLIDKIQPRNSVEEIMEEFNRAKQLADPHHTECKFEQIEAERATVL